MKEVDFFNDGLTGWSVADTDVDSFGVVIHVHFEPDNFGIVMFDLGESSSRY